jgi:23S rRNA (cytosine1962-C5)-methyltransferase
MKRQLSPDSARLRLRVSATAESILRGGHPWLFAESIRDQNREGRLGELAVVYDRKNCFLAVGLFDPGSPLRLRVLHAGKPQTIDAAWWRRRLSQALERRQGLFDDQTTGYRWINGESDGWPGLVLDRYDTTLVLKLYTAAWLPRLDEVVALIREALAPAGLVLRLSRNIQETARGQFGVEEGWLEIGSEGAGERESWRAGEQGGRGAGERGSERRPSPSPPHPPTPSPAPRSDAVTFLETGLRFEADVVRGQKTGFFLDQRENRRLVESLARGCEVLNAFSFSGGFSLYAGRGGARTVTDIDISAHALAAARRNFALNQANAAVAECRHEAIRTDAFEWLGANSFRKFDLVILDPPSLARRETERAGAIQAYGKLTQQGLACLRPGGVLVASSCSAHVSAEEFFGIVREAARQSGRKWHELKTTGHPPDHPATLPEAQYLKCFYSRALS